MLVGARGFEPPTSWSRTTLSGISRAKVLWPIQAAGSPAIRVERGSGVLVSHYAIRPHVFEYDRVRPLPRHDSKSRAIHSGPSSSPRRRRVSGCSWLEGA